MAYGWRFLLLTLGVCGPSSSVPHQFHVVKQLKNWTEAQQYCREEFTDLATTHNEAEIDEIRREMQGAGFDENRTAWIGLKQGSWQWSLADEGFYGVNETEFRNWDHGQPNSEHEECVVIYKSQWSDYPCHARFNFICYTGRSYSLVSLAKTWSDAQSYCRHHYRDLASVRNNAENNQIANQITSMLGERAVVWIGLFRDALEWSDGSNSSIRSWSYGEPSHNSMLHGFCVQMLLDGWKGAPCHMLYYFVCYEALPTVEVVSPHLPFYSGDDVTLRCDIPKYTGQHQYVWIKNKSPVPDETSQTITTTLPEDAGQYQCYRRRGSSSVTPYISKPLGIDYHALPNATVDMVSPPLPFYSGDDVTLRCDIAKYSDWHQYVWLKDNSLVPGKTNQAITITLPLEAGQYQCSGERGDRPTTSSVSSSVDIISNDLPNATMVVSPPPPFYSGDEITLKCNITHYTDWRYSWLKDNIPVPGKTNQNITITLPLEAGRYQCSGQRQDRPMASTVSSSVDIISNVKRTQIVRVEMEMASDVDVEDPGVQEAFLKQIKERLKVKGLPANAQLSWRKQPDGKVFHKKKNDKKKEKRDEF